MIKNVHHPKYKALVNWLIAARKSQGLTVREFAKLIDEPHQLVGKIETRVRKLSALEYWQYCRALGLNPEEGIKIMESIEG